MRRSYSIRNQPALEQPEVNLTPLIDVVFVILIMFIVIAPLLELDRVTLASSPSFSPGQSVQETSPIAVYVHKENTIYFNQALTTPSNLVKQLQQAKIEFPSARPQIFHDREAFFGTYQEVKNAAESAGFNEIDIILKPS